MKAKVFVSYRDGVLDPQGQTIYEVLKQHGHDSIHSIRVGKMIEIDLDDMDTNQAKALLEEISDKMLANPITETFRIELP
ncbi:phosphoribosylformylglycinamidine synthase subunit PurS [bacterium]|nr:phosphoribosylformylglycinamidine synthase subunit PurS [bacterium]MBU1636704.1 phosphoribosylformylglycinamidine synthase subunit PurS [bacterium]MBU1920468.1 phosphoribosylformylglycinamidine synthase subunit PurS [bacterium]